MFPSLHECKMSRRGPDSHLLPLLVVSRDHRRGNFWVQHHRGLMVLCDHVPCGLLIYSLFLIFFSQYTLNRRDPRTNQYKADLQTPRRKFLNIQLAAVGEAVKRNVSHKDLVGGQGGLKFFVTTWLERWASTYYCHQILDIYIVITWGKEIILVFFGFFFLPFVP